MLGVADRSRLGVVGMTVFLDLLGFGIIIPLMPHYAQSYGATPFVYGLLAASYSLMQFVFVPIWGRISDRIGRRPVLLVSIAGSALAFMLFGLAGSLAALFVARLLSGAATANLSVAQAYVADITLPEDRARGMGLIGAAFGLGFVVGPFVGGELSRVAVDLPLGAQIRAGTAPFFFAAALSAINWVLAFRLLPESHTHRGAAPAGAALFSTRRLREIVRRSGAGPLFAISFLVTAAFSMMEQSLILFGDRRLAMTPVEAGRFLGYIGVLIVIVQGGLVGPLAKRFGEARLLVAGTFLMVPGLLFIAPAHSYLAMGLAMIPLALGSGLGNPSLHALLSRRTLPEEQGGVLGISQSLGSLGRVIGPSLGGFFFGSVGIGSPFIIGAGIMLVAALLAAWVLRQVAEVPAGAHREARVRT